MSFKLVNEVTGDGDLVVRKFISDKTGLSLVVAHVEGPLVHGYLTVATEAHDDEGIPHTLEHLVFVGSQSYPFKGVLDLVANRCMADGTNAWTDTDHTCYTLANAGSEGFLSLLPIYLDHVLYPTLSDAAYVTEVHHINGQGDDAGVVYCEMQGRENSGDSRVTLEMLRAMYPGHCGYKSETGGILKDIRNTLSNEKIRKYHQEVYRPENLCVIVAGNVKESDVIGTLVKFENDVVIPRQSRKQVSKWSRPWQSPIPPLEESVEKVIEFPCDDDDNGIVHVAWRGPSSVTEVEQSTIISLLFDYLNDTAASPLQRAFVERKDPFCSAVSFNLIENSEMCMYISFDSVYKEKLEKVKDHLFDVLNTITGSKSGTKVDGIEPGINMERMKEVIHRKKLQTLSTLESSPHFRIASSCIGEFLYGRRESGSNDLKSRLCEIPTLDRCANEPEAFWINILNHYFIGKKYVCIIGKASPALKEKLAKEEKARIEKQAKELGEEGLKQKQKLLDESKEKNEILPPKEMISNIPVPSTEGIEFFSISRHGNDPSLNGKVGHQNGSEVSNVNGASIDSSLSKIPFRILVDDLKTNFVTFRVLMNSSDVVPPELRLYLPLFCNLLTESSINRDGQLIPYEDIVTQLAADTIQTGASVGVQGQFEQIVLLGMKVEVSKYHKGINWLKEILYDVQFLEDRVKTVSKRMVNDLALAKRKGNRVVSDLMRSLNYDPNSNGYNMGTFRQVNFLNRLLSKLDTSPESTLNDLNKLQNILTSLENITVHVSMNVSKVQSANSSDLFEPWTTTFLPPKIRQSVTGQSIETRKITPDADLIKGPSNDGLNGVIAGVGSVDSNFLSQSVSSIRSHMDANVAPLLVLIQYLTQLEVSD